MQEKTVLSKRVLVAGATGQQGGAVAGELLKRGHFVRALTRKPDSPAAKALEKKGAEILVGSFDDADALAAAARGTDCVFAMGTPYEGGADAEKTQTIALIDAAAGTGTGHIVYGSVCDAGKATGIPHFDSKYDVEQHLASLDVPHTILGPVWFMENALSPWYLPELKEGRLPIPLPADRVCQQVAIQNIGQVAMSIIDAGDPYFGKRIDLAGDELSGARMAEIISEVSGKPIQYIEVPIEEMMKMNEDWGKMFDWFNKVGYSTDIEALKGEFTWVDWLTFEDWAKAQDWSVIK